MDHVVELQERKVLFAQSLVERFIRKSRQQSERNLEIAHKLLERVEEQGDAFRRLLGGSISTYMDFPYLPFSYHGRV
jgi:hypothetical protein